MKPRAVENPSLIERFISSVPLPYPLAAIFWAAILGSPGYYTVQLLETGTINFTLDQLPAEVLFFVVPLYLFLMPRYMRMRVVAAEASIVPRLSGGEDDYHNSFGRMTLTAPVVPLTLVIGTITLSFRAFSDAIPKFSALAIYNTVTIYMVSFALSTSLWMFAMASLGLHRLGGSSLKLGPFLEERMMGAKPMGSLALSLTVVYFGGLLIVILLFSSFIGTDTSLQALIFAFLFLGVAMFFLPLNSIHARMQAEKRRLQRDVGARYLQLSYTSSSPAENATLEDVRNALTRLSDLQQLEMIDKKVAALPTWPFDIQLVSKFITIVLSVTAVLLSRVITGFLHI